ncbi:PIN domain-containing protein [Thermodesulforhabdus norvegica]|uniref:Predicted nucleic-acid-binding protein, contains PIN domain n=1 Tax=Thermodesulforhabdus norvegica TaxID=39841 RepID=A0A1I4W763_9BACT|nr:PIN domain-containing protein [Thermodesulforhabdus norvegica]SFN09498.1 Predicted nucleic-acid-binding protein, contains PIN domain [Thermodesulforhabdus norvegica]
MPSEKSITLVDANVILRYLLKDNKELYAKAEEVFNAVFDGKAKVLLLESVLAEVVYVLQKLYKVSRSEISEVLRELIELKGIKALNKSHLLKALEIFENKNLDFVDCLLCAYGKEREVITFDKNLQRCLKSIP